MLYWHRLLMLLLLYLLAPLCSAGTVNIDLKSDQVILGNYMEYLVDSNGRLSREEALQQNRWHAVHGAYPNFGYTSDTYWLRLNLRNVANEPEQRLLEIAYPVLDHVEVWVQSGVGEGQHYILGDKLPFHLRPYIHRNYVIPLTLQTGTTSAVVIRVQSTSALQVPTTLWTASRFHQHDQTDLLLLGIYYGVIICMLLYNLFLFISLREMSGAYYVIWVGGMLMFMLSLNGIAFQYLWPSATQWNDQAIVAFLGLAVLFAILFTNDFLDLKAMPQRWMKDMVVIVGILAAMATASAFLLPYSLGIRFTIAVAVLSILGAFSVAFIRWRQGVHTARYYVLSWSFVMAGGAILAMNKFGIVERNIFTENATQIGSAMEVLLLSFALAERLNTERRLREEAQHKAFVLQREANVVLEKRVQERTHALETANRRLQEISITDALTGIPNRRHFDEQLMVEIKRAMRSGMSLGLLVIDVDFFKSINDRFGHQSGDEVLKTIAQILRDGVRRESDTLARFGGEEFCILLPNATPEGVQHVGESLREAVAESTLNIEREKVKITISVGCSSLSPTSAQDYERLLAAADTAVYAAKREGRNRVVYRAPDA